MSSMPTLLEIAAGSISSPSDLLTHNDMIRNRIIEPSLIEDINVLPMQFTLESQVFAPHGWKPERREFHTDMILERFFGLYPEVKGLSQIDNVAICGGSVAKVMQIHAEGSNVFLDDPVTSDDPSDIDIFIYGVSDLWSKVAEVVNTLRENFRVIVEDIPLDRGNRNNHFRGTHIKEILHEGVLTFYFCIDYEITRKVQIILRNYPDLETVLYGFDIPSCSVAISRDTIRLTHLAAYAHLFRVNIVSPSYRSTTYEKRLAKYFRRGFALSLPLMKKIKKGEIIMPHMTLSCEVALGYIAFGKITKYVGDESDYDQKAPYENNDVALDYIAYRMNMRTISARVSAEAKDGDDTPMKDVTPTKGDTPMKGDAPIKGMGATAIMKFRLMTHKSYYSIIGNECLEKDSIFHPYRCGCGIQFDGLTTPSTAPPAFASLDSFLRRSSLCETLNDYKENVIRALTDTSSAAIKLSLLRNNLGLKDDEVIEICMLAATNREMCDKHWEGGKRDALCYLCKISGIIDVGILRFMTKYDSIDKFVQWWIMVDPARQYNNSLNPRIENPQEWYGEHLGESDPINVVTNEDILAFMLHA